MTNKEIKKLLAVMHSKNECNMTLEDVYNEYLESDAQQLKSETLRGYQSQWNNHIGPRFGGRKIADIQSRDVSQAHREIGGPVANRAIAFISRLYKFAQSCDYVDNGTNPARGVRLHKSRARRRVANGGELGRIGDGIRRWGLSNILCERQFACLVKIILLTGARVSEISEAERAWLDLDNNRLELPDSKTGEKAIYFCDDVKEQFKLALSMFPDADQKFIFPGRNRHETIRSVRYMWRQFKLFHDLPDDLRMHDLRRTYASIAISNNVPVQYISKQLGHSSTGMTEKVYAHLLDDTKRDTAKQIGSIISPHLAEA